MKIRKNGGAAVRKQGEKYRDQEPEIKEMETEKRERERGDVRTDAKLWRQLSVYLVNPKIDPKSYV